MDDKDVGENCGYQLQDVRTLTKCISYFPLPLQFHMHFKMYPDKFLIRLDDAFDRQIKQERTCL